MCVAGTLLESTIAKCSRETWDRDTQSDNEHKDEAGTSLWWAIGDTECGDEPHHIYTPTQAKGKDLLWLSPNYERQSDRY